MSNLTGKPAPSWTLNQDSEAFISSYQLQKAFAILQNVRSILEENSKHRSKAFNIDHTTHDAFLQLVSRCENFIHGDSSLPPDVLRELWVETSIHMLFLLFEIERSVNDQVSWRIFRRKHARREAAIDILRFDSALQNISHLYDLSLRNCISRRTKIAARNSTLWDFPNGQAHLSNSLRQMVISE